MAAMIDYRGHRLVAMNELPIRKDTLRYGCADASRECPAIINKDPKISRKMKKAASILNIKEHSTESLVDEPVKLYSPAGFFFFKF